MLLRELFVKEAEPTASNDDLRNISSASMTSSSSWASELFGRANQAANKPWELDQDNNTPGTNSSGAEPDSTEPTTGSISSAGVDASQDLITMLKGFEGYGEKVDPSQGNRSNVRPYWDVAQWSIGYGSYAGSRNRSQRPDVEWTPRQAEAQLIAQLRPYRANVEQINRRGSYQWSSEQLDALTSFAYNIGSINQLTNSGRRSNREIADKMLEYNKAGGRALEGLTNRRRIERQKFLNGMASGRLDYTPGGST